MTRLAWGDERLLQEMKKLEYRGSLRSIQRYKNGSAASNPTTQLLGTIVKALSMPESDIDFIIGGYSKIGNGTSLKQQQDDQWQELLAYMRQQSNLPYEVQQRRAAAKTAIAEEDYERAKSPFRKS